jgi:EmrB/QacA subfamily drug resistance transporter
MKPPCDEGEILSSAAESPCARRAGPWILAVTILGSSMAFIDGTVVNVALPALQSAFHASLVDVQWVIESYALLLGALILAGGSVGDLYGRRRMFLLGVVVFAAGSIWCGLAPDIRQLILARAVQGLGAAFLVPGSLAIISASFDESRRGAAIGTWSGFTAITTALGPVLGGWLIEHASWRWAFFLNVPLAVAVLVIGLWRVPESRSQDAKKLDVLGTTLVTLGLGGVVYALIESPRLGWGDARVAGSLMGGLLCLVGFVVVERRSSHPMLSFALFRSGAFAGANLLTLFLYAAFGIFFFLVPLNLIQVQGYSATEAGAATLPMIVLLFALSRWSGGLVDRYGARLPLVAGPLVVALGFVLFAVPGIGGSYWRTFCVPFLVVGFGMAVSVAPLTTVVMNSVDRDHAGTASGINNAVSRVAGLLATAVLGILVVHAFSQRLEGELSALKVDATVRNEVLAQRISLAAIQIPAEIDPASVLELKRSIANAFVFAFRVMMCLCAALALLSAVQTALWIPERAPISRSRQVAPRGPDAEPAS